MRHLARPGLALESVAGGGRVAAIEGTICHIAIEEVLTRFRGWAVRLVWHPRGVKAAPDRLRLEGDGHAVQVLPPRDATVGESALAAATMLRPLIRQRSERPFEVRWAPLILVSAGFFWWERLSCWSELMLEMRVVFVWYEVSRVAISRAESMSSVQYPSNSESSDILS